MAFAARYDLPKNHNRTLQEKLLRELTEAAKQWATLHQRLGSGEASATPKVRCKPHGV